MMKRSFVGLCVLVTLVGIPRPAFASGWDLVRWIDRLSGPRDFWGHGPDIAFFCYGVDANGLDTKRFHFDAGCYSMDREEPRVAFGFKIAWLGGVNTLPYAPPNDADKPDVNAMPLLVTLDVGIDNKGILEAGSGIGFVRFHGRGYSFTRFAIEPRVIFKPLAIGRRDGNKERWRDILQIKASFVAIPGSLEASDFDAIGSFESSGELIPTISIGADFVAWFRR
jgi:hypothetical protein